MNQENNLPEVLKGKRQYSQKQYEILKRCSDKKDMTEWNQWRKDNPTQDIELDIANLDNCWLQGTNFGIEILSTPDICFRKSEKLASSATLCSVQLLCSHCEGSNFLLAHLEVASAHRAHFEGANFNHAFLNLALFAETHLEGACLDGSHLQGANFERAIVDGATSIWKCKVDRETNFAGVGLDNCRIDPATKQLLESNIRRKNWDEWYKEHSRLKLLVKPFWWLSDYGISTKRIIFSFFSLALIFALLYRLFPNCVIVNGEVGDIRGFWHALYFSVVTMTTLGFGDIAANPDSWFGQTLLMIQVILGYVLLGALVTRFAVLFTAGGPAGKFADEKE